MDKHRFSLHLEAPSAEEFAGLRKDIGWGETDLLMAQASLDNSLFHVTIRDTDALAGMGRVVGDGVMYFYIQDVVVAPEFQGQGLGHALMEAIEAYLISAVRTGSTVGLFAAKGKEGFYARYGYLARSGDPLGKGMCRFV